MTKKQEIELQKIIDEELPRRFGEPYSGLHADISLGLFFCDESDARKKLYRQVLATS